jgi:trans-aconitate 2-methyltransferase
MSWSVAQYCKFEEERNRPVRDLLARIPAGEIAHAADIGCGPGNSTELLQSRFPGALISAIDSSPDMIAAARQRLSGINFEITDITTWRNHAPLDLILANAVLQWLPDHASLLPSLIAKLKTGGSLAVQIPDNLDEPAHRLMRAVAAEGPWFGQLPEAAAIRAVRHTAEWYYRALRTHAAVVDLWRTTYYHPLAGVSALVEWFKGTGLRPFLDPLGPAERSAFLAEYAAALARAYPPEPDGTVLLPFPRLFFVATR